VALNRDCLGREYESIEPYEVTRGKIAEFAAAIGDPSPLYRDPEAAGEYGYSDVPAPPTFPIVLGSAGLDLVAADAELGLDFSAVVHGSQRFDYTRPLLAGDVVRTVTRISEIKSLGKTEMLTLSSEVSDVAHQHVVTALSMLVVRGEATEDGR
jgi:acyl dehydratase